MTTEPAPRALHDRRLLAALGVALVFHGGLLVAGSFRRTYDAYVHIFFADHYARDWFSTWETRWYTGFTTTSYPPGSHQAVALVSKAVGLEWAFVVVQLAAVVGLVVGVHRFARIWVRPEAAGWAALLAALSSSVAEAIHTFGQLPTTFSLAFLLNAAPFVHRWIVHGRGGDLVVATLCTAATTAGHHVTTLFGSVFFLGPVVATALLDRWRTPSVDETDAHPRRVTRSNLTALVARRVRRVAPATARATVFGGLVVVALVVVVLPYWLWSSSDPITQIPIPHASRSDYLTDTNAGLVFWAVPWGALLTILPLAIGRGFTSRAWPLAGSVVLLTVLGTGGTTPIPRLLLRGAYDVLTLDRFTFWATIAVLPLAGWTVDSLVRGRLAAWIRGWLGRRALPGVQISLAALLVVCAVFAADLSSLRRFQPDPIDPAPIVAFLDKDQHDRWRYLTLGFGDQMAWLSANTTATTVDGNYHSARRLPELTTTPVERLEGAKFRGVPGIGSLQQFLAVPGKYHLKFVFSNDEFYDPLLAFSGWHRVETLVNGIVVWEREDVSPLPSQLPTREIPRWQALLWGTVPMASLGLALLALLSTAIGLEFPGPLARLLDELRRRLGHTRVARRWVRIDRWLARAARGVGEGDDTPRWQTWRRRSAATSPETPPTRHQRLAVSAVAVTVGVALVVTLVPWSSSPKSPTAQVDAYYDDLDFGRTTSAHDRLDPSTRPALDQYLLERSVDDGLVASYGQLEHIETTLLETSGDRAVVRAELDYVTSLAGYDLTVDHELVRRDGQWFLTPPETDVVIPPDQFVRRTGLDLLAQGRRRVTAGTTAYADVIDRPEVVTADARLVRADGRWVLVGEVVNTDVDPADITITGQLLDREGAVLAQYDAAQITVHKLLPKERAPFRIEFEGIAGALDARDPIAGDFVPGAMSDLTIDDGEVTSFAVYTKAVVTGRELDRPLVAEDLAVTTDGTSWFLEGTLRNDGTTEVTVPHLLFTYRDTAGVKWVDHAYLDRAVRPQRSIDVRVPLPDIAGVTDSGLPGDRFDNGITDLADAVPAPWPLLTDGGSGLGLDLTVSGFVRDDGT